MNTIGLIAVLRQQELMNMQHSCSKWQPFLRRLMDEDFSVHVVHNGGTVCFLSKSMTLRTENTV